MTIDASVFGVLDESEAARRQSEMLAFIGPHADVFMPVWAAMKARAAPRVAGQKRPRARMGFIAMAFFLGPCWFFYRKMWAWAWGLTAAIVALAFLPLPSRVTLPLGIVLAVFGRQAYLKHAETRIAKLRGGAQFADLDVLRQAGGVSPVAGWVSSVVIVGLTVLAVVLLIGVTSMNGGRLPADT